MARIMMYFLEKVMMVGIFLAHT